MIKKTIPFFGSSEFALVLDSKFIGELCRVRLFDDVCGKNQTIIGKIRLIGGCDTFLEIDSPDSCIKDFCCEAVIPNTDIKNIIILDEKVKINYIGIRKAKN